MIRVKIRKRFAPGAESVAFTLDVDFEAGSGISVLFGPSGSGKTLTLDSIAGFARPDEGRILLDDDILFDAASGVHLAPQLRRCGYVFQNYALFPHMTLRENLEFAAERLPRLERHRRIVEMLDAFRLGDVAGRKPRELSGGQKQRCSIARALLAAPKLLLLDEPGRGLDAALRDEFYAVLRQVRAEFGTPVILVTHDLDECFELGDEMFVFREGKVVQSGAPAKVFEKPANLEVARLFGKFNLIPGEIRALDPARKVSRLRVGDTELAGPYLPGHLIGDRVWLYLRATDLRAWPRASRPGANQVPVILQRVVQTTDLTRLEFDDDLRVETTDAIPQADREAREWTLEIPPSAIRVL